MGCGGSSYVSQPSCAKIWFLTCPLQKDSYSFVKTAVYERGVRGASRNRFFLLPSWAHAAEAHVLGTRCVAAGPLGLAWPPSIP